jgi:hypothetical protein
VRRDSDISRQSQLKTASESMALDLRNRHQTQRSEMVIYFMQSSHGRPHLVSPCCAREASGDKSKVRSGRKTRRSLRMRSTERRQFGQTDESFTTCISSKSRNLGINEALRLLQNRFGYPGRPGVPSAQRRCMPACEVSKARKEP